MPVVGNGTERTVFDVIEEVRRYLEGSHPGRVNVLATALNETATSVVLADDVVGVTPGAVLEIGLEQMYVRSVDAGTKTATVIREWGLSPTSTHAIDDLVRVSPSYHAHDIYLAVLDEISALNGTGLVSHQVVEFECDGSTQIYDTGLDTTIFTPLYVQEAVQEQYQQTSKWRPVSATLATELDVNDFVSGYGIQLRSPRHSASRVIRATVATTFARPLTPASEVSEDALGTAAPVTPIVAVGAAWRMLLGKEAQRLNPDASHGSRRAEEIQPGSIAFLGRALQAMKFDLTDSALNAQQARYPYRTAS